MFALQLVRTGFALLCTAAGGVDVSSSVPADAAKNAPRVEREEICELAPSACVQAEPVGFSPGSIVAVTHPKTSAPDEGSKTSPRFMVPPRTLEAHGEFAFITGGGLGSNSSLALSDATLFRNGVRRAFGDLLELSVGSSFLLKAPAQSDWFWQGASLGAWLEALPGVAALLEFKAGPLFDGRGSVWSNRVGLARKWKLDRESRLVFSISELFTGMDETGHLGARTSLEEIVLGGELQLGRDRVAAWAAVEYAVPIAHAGNLPQAPANIPMAPTVRMNLQLGGMLRMGGRQDWEFYAYYARIDRGELRKPGSMLPVIDGGFDQNQFVLGISRRFGFVPSRRPSYR